MTGYVRVLLREMVDQIGEDKVKLILSNFSCPQNGDVEDFLRTKAIDFDRQGVSSTQLVFTSHRSELVLIGYFSLANKVIEISAKNLNSKLRQRIRRFGARNSITEEFQIALPLIAQLGKNFNNNYEKLISGDELLKLALEQVAKGQRIFGGKLVYLECEDAPGLLRFYDSNGFVKFNDRELDEDERRLMKGKKLVQMIRYMDPHTYD